MKPTKVEQAIEAFITASPRSPKEIVDALQQSFDVSDIRDAIWEMLDRHKVEVTPDRKLKLEQKQVARAS